MGPQTLKRTALLSVLLFTITAQAQSEKELKQRAKAESETAKRAEKERLKRPPEISINAAANKVKPLLIRAMTDESYILRDDSSYRLLFTKQIKGFRAGLIQGLTVGGSGGPPIWEVSFTTSESAGATTIIANMEMTIQNAYGRTNRTDLNRQKESRRQMDSLLSRVKSSAETIEPTPAPSASPRSEVGPITLSRGYEFD